MPSARSIGTWAADDTVPEKTTTGSVRPASCLSNRTNATPSADRPRSTSARLIGRSRLAAARRAPASLSAVTNSCLASASAAANRSRTAATRCAIRMVLAEDDISGGPRYNRSGASIAPGTAQSTHDALCAQGECMATCPECDAELEIDDDDLEEMEIGDPWDCEACGSRLRVANLDPLEFESEEEDEDEDADEESKTGEGDDDDDFEDDDDDSEDDDTEESDDGGNWDE